MQLACPAQPVEQHVRHPGVELDQREGRVARIEVGELVGVARHAGAGFLHEVVEGSVVELGEVIGKRHVTGPPG